MTYCVLPEIRKHSAATSFGFNLLWTCGVFEPPPALPQNLK